MKELNDGKTFWTIKHVCETEDYIIGSAPPSQPWQGRLEMPDWVKTDHMILYGFHPDTLELDYDSNAMAVVSEKDLFNTFEEAKEAFLKESQRYLEILESYQQDYKQFVEKYRNEATEENRWFIEPQL
jgi:hypothetical protein